MPVAAANPAGGLAGAGVGLGMGMAMAGPMMQGAGAAPAPQTPPPPPAPAAWHLAENGQSTGPFTMEQVAQGIATGRIRPETLVWTAGMAGLDGRRADAAARRPLPGRTTAAADPDGLSTRERDGATEGTSPSVPVRSRFAR